MRALPTIVSGANATGTGRRLRAPETLGARRAPHALPELDVTAEVEPHGAPAGEAATVWRNKLAGLTLTMLLYLGGETDLLRIVHPGEKPLKTRTARTDPERYRDLAEPTVQSVGKAFTHAVERWEIEHRGDEGIANVPPHMRPVAPVLDRRRPKAAPSQISATH